MTFVNDSGEILDTIDPIYITKQAVSFFGFKITGDYSINFTVPNNSITRRVLNYEGPQMTNQVAFTRQAFTLMRDGNPFIRGAIVIQDDNNGVLDCYFVSGNSNWVNLLQGLITELDYSGVTNGTNYESNLAGGGLTYKSATSGTIYPLIDWGMNYNYGANYFFSSILPTDSSYDQFKQTFSGQNNTFPLLYPCFFLKTLVQEIMNQNGLKIAGNILTNELYLTAILTPSNGELKRKDDYSISASGPTISITSSSAVSSGFINSEIDPFGWLSFASTILYTPNISGYIFIRVQYTCSDNIKFELKRTDGGSSGGVIAASVSRDVSTTGAVNAGFSYRLEISDAGYAAPVNFRITRIDIYMPQKIGNVNDYVRPDYFLPAIKQIDIIRYVIQSFGCVASFNDASKTITINSIESFKLESSQDWSSYYISHRSEYTVQPGKHNYLRVNDGDESQITTYNNSNTVKFGEADILTSNNLKDSTDVFKSPFGATGFGLSKNGFYQPFIGLYSLEDVVPQQIGNTLGGPLISGAFTSTTSTGSSSRFSGSQKDAVNPGSFSGFVLNEIVRIVFNGTDYGYFVVSLLDVLAGFIEVYGFTWSVTGAGQIYRQTGSYNNIKPRILLTKNLTVSDYSNQSSIDIDTSFFTPFPAAYYIKSKTNLQLDRIKDGLHYGNPNVETFTDPSLKDLYFNKITNIFKNPSIRMQTLLPESVFQNFDFSTFIYVKTETIDGYFFVESIVNYRDGNTPVEVNLYML